MFVGKIKKEIRKAVAELVDEDFFFDILNSPKMKNLLAGQVVEYSYVPGTKEHKVIFKFSKEF